MQGQATETAEEQGVGEEVGEGEGDRQLETGDWRHSMQELKVSLAANRSKSFAYDRQD